MTEPTAFPADKRQAAADALKRDRDARHANSVKQGRAIERKEWCDALGVQTREEATEIGHLRKELKDRPTLAELGHAKHASRGFAMLTGAVIGAALMLAAGAIGMNVFQTQFASFGHEMAITGAVTQQLNPPQRCLPGEHLPDGRVCPQAQP